MAKISFKVKGMHCPSCEKLLQMELGGLPGITSVKADWKSGAVALEGVSIDTAVVKKAIKAAGYSSL